MKNISKINNILRRIFQNAAYAIILSPKKSFTFKKFLNFVFINFQYLLGFTKVKGYPYILTIDPNNICNLNCIFCHTGRNLADRPKGQMSFKEFKLIFDQFKDYVFILYLFLWGEPFLNEDIFRMIKYASKNKVFVAISTNLNIPNAKMKNIIESELDYLVISLDGFDQESYEKYRKNGNFGLVIKNIKSLLKLKKDLHKKNPIIHLQHVIFKHTEKEFGRILKIDNSLNPDLIEFVMGIYGLDVKSSKKNNFLSYDTKIKKVSCNSCFKCSFPWNSLVVHWDGGVSPCKHSFFKKDDFGHISTNFKQLWNNEKFIRIRKERKNPKTIKEYTICNDCCILSTEE